MICGAGYFEVKEVAATRKEIDLFRRRAPRFMHEDHRRRTVRNSIKTAAKQLKYASDRSLPGIVVLRLDEEVRFNLLDLEIICFGKRGSISILNSNTMERIRYVAEVAGGRRIVTPHHNTRISAIALLSEYPSTNVGLSRGRRIDTKEPKLSVFHSPFAKYPLEPGSLSSHPSMRIVHRHYQVDPETGLASLI
jgi:hypothetical protein